jgi:type II secretory pathway pseudopilin PulG
MRTRDLPTGNAPALTPLRVSPRSTRHAPALRDFARRIAAFTLIEVMIACGIFFMATFAILALVSGTLRNARALQRGDVDAGMAASQIFQMLKTNRQADISGSGDFGDTYPDFSYEFSSSEYMTNGLLQVDIVVNKRGLQKPFDTLSIWVYSPDAKSGPGGLNLH